MTPKRWFERHAVNHQTETVCTDLAEDVFYETGLTAYLHNNHGELSLNVADGAGGVFVLSNGEGNLPDGTQLTLTRTQTHGPCELIMRKDGMTGDILERAAVSYMVTDAILLVCPSQVRLSA